MVVPEQPVDDLDHAGRAAVVHFERMLARAGKQLGEVDQPCRIGTVVAVDRLVVVAHAEHRTARRGEKTDQQEVGRCEVLELVDEHDPTRALRSPAGARISQEYQQRPVDLVVEVDSTTAFERLAVQRPCFGKAVDVAVVAALCLVGIDETEADHGERFDPRSDRVAVATPREIDEIADDAPHIGFVDGAPLLRLRRKRR